MNEPPNIAEIDRKIEAVLKDFSISYWLKNALTTMIRDRDPLDAAFDARLLAELLGERNDAIMKFMTEHSDPRVAAEIIGARSDAIVRLGIEFGRRGKS